MTTCVTGHRQGHRQETCLGMSPVCAVASHPAPWKTHLNQPITVQGKALGGGSNLTLVFHSSSALIESFVAGAERNHRDFRDSNHAKVSCRFLKII